MDSPLTTAHRFAQAADDYTSDGLLIPALESHTKAANAFQTCVNLSSDDKLKRTLEKLMNEHIKSAKDLERKIAALREKGIDPAVPQLPTSDARRYAPRGTTGGMAHEIGRQGTASPGPNSRNRMMDSAATNMNDESFMVLNGQRSDPGDAFNLFWKATEGMLNNLSQPVAFATAPLYPESSSPTTRRIKRDGNSSSETDLDDSLTTRLKRNLGLSVSASTKGWNRTQTKADPTTIDEDFEDDDMFEDGEDLTESFFVVESSGPAFLKKENAQLKEELERTQKRLAEMDRHAQMRKDRDTQLQESIHMARKHAQRAMGASMMNPRQGQGQLDFAALNLNVPPIPAPIAATPPFNFDREAQLNRKIKDLEEELRLSRVEVEKQRLQIVRFREKWAQLKESAKKKKETKAAAEALKSGVGQSIAEEPEAEQQALELT